LRKKQKKKGGTSHFSAFFRLGKLKEGGHFRFFTLVGGKSKMKAFGGDQKKKKKFCGYLKKKKKKKKKKTYSREKFQIFEEHSIIKVILASTLIMDIDFQ